MDQRKHKRFRAKEGAFAFPQDHICDGGPIIDIGPGGLSFSYIDRGKRSTGSFELVVLHADHGFCLKKIAVKSVSDFTLVSENPFSSVPVRRCNVQFEELTPSQKSQLQYFIRNHTVS